MRFLALAFAVLMVLSAFSGNSAWAQTAAGPSTAMTPTPDDRAKQWLGLIDDQNYADAFNQMGVGARAKSSEEKFSGQIGGTRAPLGAMSSRTLKDVKLTKTLSGMRDGQYATVRYDSTFAHKAAAVESVNLISEKGAWSVIGYSVN